MNQDGDETCAFIVGRRPPSSQRGPNPGFQEQVRQEARRQVGSRNLLVGSLYARILWFHRGPRAQDVDNIVKNILDALKGVVYPDDGDICQCLVRAIRSDRGTLVFAVPPARSPVVSRLQAMLAEDGVPHVVYIEVGTATSEAIYVGELR